MLIEEPFRDQITDFDREVFDRFLPHDNPLLLAVEIINGEAFQGILRQYYSQNLEKPAIDPLRGGNGGRGWFLLISPAPVSAADQPYGRCPVSSETCDV